MKETPLDEKSSIEDIKKRFDNDVERFSNLETGQEATIDAPLAMDLIAQAACRCTRPIRKVLDIGEYLCTLGGDAYRAKVFEYIDREDSPRPVTFQLDLLRKVGFDQVDLLHKNSCFAAFGAVRKGISCKGKRP